MAGVFLLLLVFPAAGSRRRAGDLWQARPVRLRVDWAAITTAPGDLDSPFEDYENPLAFIGSKGYIVAIVPIIGFCLVSVCSRQSACFSGSAVPAGRNASSSSGWPAALRCSS